mmetsp:Transcript_11765/g.33089  ORF Transcript_11765/g.33089 Transcript_11765/m.33089 type:complete len:297 (+) Transcript_11765:189-1079(+)
MFRFFQCCNSHAEANGEIKVVHLSSEVLERGMNQPVHLLTSQDSFDVTVAMQRSGKGESPLRHASVTPRQQCLRDRVWLPKLRRYPVPPTCSESDPEDVRRDELLRLYQEFVLELHQVPWTTLLGASALCHQHGLPFAGDPHDAAHVQPGLLGHPLSDSGGPSDAQNRPGQRMHHRIPAGRRLEGLPHRQERRQVVQRGHSHRSGADAAAAPVQRGAHRRRGVHAPKACFRVQRDQGGAALPDVHRAADPPRPGGARRGRGTHGRPERDKWQQKRQGHRVRSHGTDVFLLQHPGAR